MKRVAGALKRMTGSSSSRSQASANSPHSSEPTPSLTLMDYEEEQEEKAKPQKQAYASLKDWAFCHIKAYDPKLLEKIGMDIDFAFVWSSIGWDEFLPVEELVCRSFSRHGFWGEISGQIVHGKFAPRYNEIQNLTLHLMHKWLAITLFLREDMGMLFLSLRHLVLTSAKWLHLYNCWSLTMPLGPQEEARRSNVYGGRITRSMSRSAAMQQPPPPQPQPQPLVPAGWAPTGYMTGVTPE
uniref:Uncharacterized protein n=1 Tax=Setaria italica TaxID=4555 RepID=K3ZNH5_SETIT